MLTHDIICQRIPLDQSLTAMLPVTLKRHPTQSWLFHEFGRLRGPLPFSENHPGLYRQCRMFCSSVKLKNATANSDDISIIVINLETDRGE